MNRDRRTTIEDVARRAGVSRATVDRVINGRGGVSAETVRKVEMAIAAFDYAPSTLSTRASTRRVAILLPKGTNPYFAAAKEAVLAQCEAHPTSHFTFAGFDPYRPETLAACLRNVPAETDSIVFVGIDNPAVATELTRLSEEGVRLVSMISDVSMTDGNIHVGQNSFRSGHVAARLMLMALGGREGTIAVLLGHLQFRHLVDRRAGFEQSIELSGRNLTILRPKPYGGDARGFARHFADATASTPDLVGVYLCGGGQPEIFDAFRALPKETAIIAHEITAETRAGLMDGTIDAVVAHDMTETARAAIEAALDPFTEQPRACRNHVHVAENLPPT